MDNKIPNLNLQGAVKSNEAPVTLLSHEFTPMLLEAKSKKFQT